MASDRSSPHRSSNGNRGRAQIAAGGRARAARGARRHIAFLLGGLALLAAGCGGKDASREEVGGPAAVLERAERQASLGAWSQAIQFYEVLEIRYPFTEENREGQLGLMYAYYRDGQPESASDVANKFIRENPRHPKVDYAYYMRGLAYFPRELGPLERLFRVDPAKRPQTEAKRSFDNFATFLQKYPDSEWAGDARQRMIFLRNAMAAYQISVARYYMTRRAYVAAANRSKRVVEEFPATPSVNDALEIMIAAYQKLGLDELAQDTRRVLNENQ